MPPVDTLCRQFSVSPMTVKSALKRMNEEGYISLCRGRCAEVTFQQSEKELSNYARRFFAERLAAFPDFYESTELIFSPFIAKGFSKMDDKDFAQLDYLVERAGADDLVNYFCFILQKADNPLLMNLYWETSYFMGFPFLREEDDPILYDTKLIRQRLRSMTASGKSGAWEEIRRTHLVFQKDVAKEMTNYLAEHIKTEHPEEKLPFTWRVYRDHPQVCYTLAVRLLHESYMGEYREMKYLPSYKRMAEKYGVSISTIRRTISILGQLGAARSINGKGTQLFSLDDPNSGGQPDFTSPVVRRNLAYFIQAYEILAYSCEKASQRVLTDLTMEERNELIGLLKECLSSERYLITLQSFFSFIAGHSRLSILKEIYGKLYSLLLWGRPLKILQGKTDLEESLIQLAKTLIECIEENDIVQCAAAVKTYMIQKLPVAKAHLINLGLEPEDFTLSPSFKLLLDSK